MLICSNLSYCDNYNRQNVSIWKTNTWVDSYLLNRKEIALRGNSTSCLPPEQAKDSGVSLVLSDWASMSAPLSSNISTTPTWPAVAAKMSGVKPKKQINEKICLQYAKQRNSNNCFPI